MDIIHIITKETEDLLNLMKVAADTSVKLEEDTYVVTLAISEENNPAQLIGHHAEVLNALQRILSIIVFQKAGEHVSLLVDVNDYRARQKERIEEIAKNVAERVMTSGEESPLHSFSPYERKVIHTFISANYPDLTSVSEGEGSSRYLLIKKV